MVRLVHHERLRTDPTSNQSANGMKLSPDLKQGTFIDRPNRFSARVDVEGEPVLAHVPNSGRMKELFKQDARVFLTPMSGANRKTAYDLSLVQVNDTLVSSDARLPSALVNEAIGSGRLEQFSSYTWRRREVVFAGSRLDLALGNGGLCYVEVKSVTLVEDGVGLFPDAPTTRGARHLEALVEARGPGHRAAVIFVVQRDDARAFAPNVPADPHFAETLQRAASSGVEVYAYRCRVTLEEVELTDELPVLLPDAT